MNRIHRIRRMGAALAVFACTLFGLGAWAPAAFAVRYPIPGGQQGAVTLRPVPPGLLKHPPLPVQVHTVIVGGMPGWQIALIAAAAALVAATLAVLLDRAWAARQRAAATAAS